MAKYRIIHITKDDKFFDSVFEQFEKDSRFDNFAYVAVKKTGGYSFRRIKHTDKVTLVTYKGMKEKLMRGDFDAVFFYSLTYDEYKWVPKIPGGKVVIWWMWGMDVYYPVRGMPPLIELPLYKPETTKLLKELYGGFWNKLKNWIKVNTSRPAMNLRKRVIDRIDFFQPVLPIEIKMMSSIEGFHAKEFYFPGSFSEFGVVPDPIKRHPRGSVLIGHSQSPGDNHLDVWKEVERFIPDGRKVVFPISYLSNLDYAEKLCEKIHSDRLEIVFLKKFLPKEEYFKLMDDCSYAVFGMIRQQAIANIYYCIKQGIKVFLYSDSVVYKYLIETGYVVYPIENMDNMSFMNPMTEEDFHKNAEILRKELGYRNAISEKVIKEIMNGRIS